MKKVWHQLTELGVHPLLTAQERRLVKLLNTLLLIIEIYLLVNISLGMVFFREGGRALIFFNILHVLTISLTYLFHYRRQYLMARINFCLSATVFISIYGIYFGERGFGGYFLIILVFLIFSVFSKAEVRVMLGMVLAAAVCFIYIMFRYEVQPQPLAQPSPEFLQMFRINNLAGFIGLAIAFGYYTFSIISETEINLEKERQKSDRLLESFKEGIHYAFRIQQALLGSRENITRQFPEAFIFFRPRDIVSGDFYWYFENERHKIIAAGDCTGHGVSAAFMTILGIEFLNDMVKSKGICRPAAMLQELDRRVLEATQKSGEEFQISDGMDIAILSIDKLENKVFAAGARNPVIVMSDGKMQTMRGALFPVGDSSYPEKSFEESEVELGGETRFYLFSDGFQDQFGGAENRKFLKKRFLEFLHSLHSKPMQEQFSLLEKEFAGWKGENNQTDDVLVIGLKV
jgi:serine phosphatase RsbU (regulator of sigma subunit)